MSYIIGKKCINCLDTSCVSVCPVDAINGPIHIDRIASEISTMSKEELFGKQLYINPDTCIDCGACEPECPVDAIFPTEEVAVSMGDKESVITNYGFYGMTYKKFEQ
jgi:NAD-dependent dihydropyrimidine dehydrogenase PreA subunit